MSMFDKFTERARKVLALAQEEAQRFDHNYIGTEHLLLGLVREGEGVAARLLSSMDVELPKVRAAVEIIIGRGEGAVIGESGLTPRAKKVIEFAVDEAKRLNDHYIGTEHLLIGLLREREGVAAGVLASFDVNLEGVRTDLQQATGLQPEPERETDIPLISDDETESSLRVEDWRNLGASGMELPSSFSDGAKAVLTIAREEARRFNHNYIGTEHILLGLVREGKGVAAKALIKMGVRLPKVRSAIEFIIGQGGGAVEVEIGLTPRSKKIIELAYDEARRLNHNYIGTEHLLLGLVREGDGIAAGVLESLGVKLLKLRSEVLLLLEVPPEADESSS